ncbi:hypothetical protein UFOVP1214_13 [uncultured Caudovirales phage]|uniref:Uncharacterized protein n=1 Tax=uncultured Caudovirales phage TaxID=2100421 RepID=A0A6J5Q942_9CAUD|nr:hypothetical protein UFOVP1046_3 [uncultured Caudovirales phage]CAB4191027.1 hypothetical protein UFOVP1214_13 [uncultured Caudovirales phage]
MEFVTTTEAGRMLGVGPDTIKKYYEVGIIDGHKLPGRGDLRIEVASVERVKGTRVTVPTASKSEAS